MTLQHTVVFTLRHPKGSQAESEFLFLAQNRLSSIPGVCDFIISQQVSEKSTTAWQFSMLFTTQDDYHAYNTHDEHTAFVRDHWIPEVSHFQEYDFVRWDSTSPPPS